MTKAIKPIIRHGLKLYPTKGLSRKDWLEFRKDYVGGSDLGTIMGVNKNFSATELFYQKIGLVPSSEEINLPIYWGKALEDVVLDKAQYYNFEDDSYMENAKLRRIVKFPYMVNNPECDWILSNVDGLEGFAPRYFTAKRIVEAKTISRQSAEMWETIPPYHFFQVQGYSKSLSPMLRMDSAIIFYLQDGRELKGYEIPIVPHLVDQMLERSFDFVMRVKKGRDILANEHNIDKQIQFLSEVEPPPDNTKAWEQFFSELYKMKQSFVRVDGDSTLLEIVEQYNELNAKMKELDDQKQGHKNNILLALKNNSANVIDFGDRGRVTYNKRLYINVK